MKLIIQIPCYNEEQTLPLTIEDLPRSIPGVDAIEYLVIDDGSTDRTIEVARKLGVHHLVRFPNNRGLAKAFEAGIDACIKLGADIIVNTDGDNQYKGADIEKLITPILTGKAQIVVGDRKTEKIAHFSPMKKRLQKIGSLFVRKLSETEVADTTSGFRAFNRNVALDLNVVSPYTYTLETIIQAGKKHQAIMSLPIGTNPKTRESRLFKSVFSYIKRSAVTILRMYAMYQPLRVFFLIGGFIFLCGLILGIRFFYYYYSLTILKNLPSGHTESVIISGILMLLGFNIGVIGILGDVVSQNRKLIENTLKRVRLIEYELVYKDKEKGQAEFGLQKEKDGVS